MPDQEPELLDVRIVAFPTTLKESPVIGLKRVFGIDDVAASRLIGNLPAVVQRGVPLVRAEYFRRALELIGAEVEVRTRGGELVQAPAPAPAPADAGRPDAESAAAGPGVAERRRRELFARADTAPLVIKEHTLLQGAPPAAAMGSPIATPANVTLREAVPAPQAGAPSRTRVAPVEIDVPVAAPATAAPADPARPAWGGGLAPNDAPGPGALEPAGHPQAPAGLALDIDLPDPPAAIRERRPNARILPGEVLPSNPPRSATARSSPPPKAALGARRSTPAPPDAAATLFDTRSFWQSLGDALALPWLGRGPYWLLALFVWSIFTALLSVIAEGFAVPGLPLVIGALGAVSLMGFAADGFRASFRCVADGSSTIAQAPSFDPARVLTRYVLSALHLMLFALITNVPVLLWYFKQAQGAPLSSTLLHPVTWLLVAFPGFYWPAALATAALSGSFAGVWKVHVGLRAVVLAPLEYLVSATIGALAFALTSAGFALLGALVELPPALGLAAFGLPLGLSHLLWGSLLGHLWRARPEAFEP